MQPGMKKSQVFRHGRLEDRERVDSFDTRYHYFMLKGCKMLPFNRIDDRIMISEYGTEINLANMKNAAGVVAFFECPGCGRRVRFLYLPEFKCRYCCNLNYRSQQRTKGSSEELRSIPAKLGLPGNQLIRPFYMHRNRYERYLKRYQKHRERYLDREDMLFGKMLKIFSGTEAGAEYFAALYGFLDNEEEKK